MNRKKMHGDITVPVCVFLLFIVTVIVGCGMSADDLYTDALVKTSNPDTAEEGLKLLLEFESRFSDDPRAPEVSLLKASLYQSLHRYGDAIQSFTDIPTNYPGSPEAVNSEFLLGYLYYEDLKDIEKAQTLLSEFIKKHPESDLAVSAEVLLQNINTPVDEWDVIKKIETETAVSNQQDQQQ